MKNMALTSLLYIGLFGSAQGAEVFITTGPDGEKVFTDRPSGDADKVDLQIRRPAAPAPTGDATENADRFAAMSPCERAQYVLAQYTNAEVLADKDDAGNTRVLDESEAAAVIERARDDVKRACEPRDEDDEQ